MLLHRYLIECGMYNAREMFAFRLIDSCVLDYKETAVRLQKEWNIQDPQQLPYAPLVEHHALVSVLNRGLLYNTQQSDARQVRRDNLSSTNLGCFV